MNRRVEQPALVCGFGLAWLVGYGAFALAYGDDPIPPIPSVVLVVLLLGGLLTAMTITVVVTAKAQAARAVTRR